MTLQMEDIQAIDRPQLARLNRMQATGPGA